MPKLMEQEPELAKDQMGQKDAVPSAGIEAELDHETEPDQFEYTILSDPLIRLKYVQLTSELVDKVLAHGTDTLVFLDKSARPVYWLMKELWPLLASSHNIKDEAVAIPQMPDVKFLNIDRGAWVKKTGGVEDASGVGVRVNEHTVGRDIADLRAAFMSKRSDVSKPGAEFERPALLDDKNIMVVDEVRVSGNTLEIAEQFLEKAFPTSRIKGAHWMHPLIDVAKGGTRFNREVPIWYSDKTALGRGIGDLNQAANEQADEVRIRRGNKFFSRRLQNTDRGSLMLRKDIKQITSEISSGQLPLRLNLNDLEPRELNDRLEFMEMVNFGIGAKELRSILEDANNEPRKFMELYKAAKSKNL